MSEFVLPQHRRSSNRMILTEFSPTPSQCKSALYTLSTTCPICQQVKLECFFCLTRPFSHSKVDYIKANADSEEEQQQRKMLQNCKVINVLPRWAFFSRDEREKFLSFCNKCFVPFVIIFSNNGISPGITKSRKRPLSDVTWNHRHRSSRGSINERIKNFKAGCKFFSCYTLKFSTCNHPMLL